MLQGRILILIVQRCLRDVMLMECLMIYCIVLRYRCIHSRFIYWRSSLG